MKDSMDLFFRIIQDFLSMPPLLVWGSGATVPCGFPTMGVLAKHLSNTLIPDLELTGNLEDTLSASKYEGIQLEIKKEIWKCISDADLRFLMAMAKGDVDEYVAAIGQLIAKFTFAHPRKLDVVTTNYDRVLEYVCAFNEMTYTDGTAIADLSNFDSARFRSEKCVNLIKVHGSLSWFEIDGTVRCLNKVDTDITPMIIIPGKNKYREASKIPYRELIQKTDIAVSSAKSFLAIGFGFNDEHITPEIIKQVNKGIPIVVVSKRITDTCLKALGKAKQYVTIEACETNEEESLVVIKERTHDDVQKIVVSGRFWSLPKFMEVFA